METSIGLKHLSYHNNEAYFSPHTPQNKMSLSQIEDHESVETVGTGRLEAINLSYKEMCELFGQPVKVRGSKISVQWYLEDDRIPGFITIWNYRSGPAIGEALKSINEFSLYYSNLALKDKIHEAISDYKSNQS